MKQRIKIKWQKFKSWLDAKLLDSNRECLIGRLVACAIVVGIVVTIAITGKVPSTMVLVPVALCLAAVIRNLRSNFGLCPADLTLLTAPR